MKPVLIEKYKLSWEATQMYKYTLLTIYSCSQKTKPSEIVD